MYLTGFDCTLETSSSPLQSAATFPLASPTLHPLPPPPSPSSLHTSLGFVIFYKFSGQATVFHPQISVTSHREELPTVPQTPQSATGALCPQPSSRVLSIFTYTWTQISSVLQATEPLPLFASLLDSQASLPPASRGQKLIGRLLLGLAQDSVSKASPAALRWGQWKECCPTT